jgi:hypothetical protein
MDEKIIKSSREIYIYFKIKTKYERNKTIDYFKSQKELINEECSDNIPLIIKDINITESETEKHIQEALDISYSELDIHKYIYIKFTYGFEFDINKEYHNLLIKYLQEIIDKHTLKYIIGEKENGHITQIRKFKITNDHVQTQLSNLNKNKKKRK